MRKQFTLLALIISATVHADNGFNNPVINSKAYSGAIFTNQNSLIINTEPKSKIDIDVPRADTNNSLMYSGAWYLGENKLIGKSGVEYNYNKSQKINNPLISSLAYSGAQFKEFN